MKWFRRLLRRDTTPPPDVVYADDAKVRAAAERISHRDRALLARLAR